MPLAKKKVVEGRGASDLVYALITKDDSTEYTTGEVKHLIPLATITKTTEASSEAHYYDNIPAVNINSEGADEISITGALIDLKTLAEITGKSYDPSTGVFSDVGATPPYVALGYKSQNTDLSEYYAWRLKGTFSIPDETANTKDDGTEGVGTELTYTGIYTTHVFTKGKAIVGEGDTVTYEPAPSKAIKVDVSEDKIDASTFFEEVMTPDTITAKTQMSIAKAAKVAVTTPNKE